MMNLEKAIFVNRAPFERLELDFAENEIAVLTAANGRGKTTILSHIVDAFYEMARPNFPQEFENKQNKLYRVSSSLYNLNQDQPSFVYLRFITEDGIIDYVDIRNNCNEEQYDKNIGIENKLPFNEIKSKLDKSGYIKKVSSNFNKKSVNKLFSNNILTYFPSYRYEQPGYLNDLYKLNINFNNQLDISGYMKNPIEVITDLPQIANWIMDVILDNQYLNIKQEDIQKILESFHMIGKIIKNIDISQLSHFINIVILLAIQQKSTIQKNLSLILTNAITSKNGNLRFGIGPRSIGGLRVQIINNDTGTLVYPTIFNLSSGEASILCLFGELLRQADNIRNNIDLDQITGIVLIDEIDKHLHIKLQKEVLPKLFGLFPNVQFIVSSHSPFFNMGLAEVLEKRSKIIDLDNFGITKDPTTNELYTEVYNLMISENERFKEMYQLLEKKIKEGTKPLIITEGKTDVKHFKKAKEKLNIECDIEFYEIVGDWGDSQLKLLLEQLSKVQQRRKIIGIFDRDVPTIIIDIENNSQLFKDYTNNVYAFCIPIPTGRENYTNISIEFYYSDDELKKEKDGKCLYFDNEVEFRQSASNKKQRTISKLDIPKLDEENTKKIFDENIGTLDWIHSKSKFAELIENDEEFISDFDFTKFQLIFDKIQEIINHNF